ncbi:hypothetical protein D3C73_1529980 [compost metagenome]
MFIQVTTGKNGSMYARTKPVVASGIIRPSKDVVKYPPKPFSAPNPTAERPPVTNSAPFAHTLLPSCSVAPVALEIIAPAAHAVIAALFRT